MWRRAAFATLLALLTLALWSGTARGTAMFEAQLAVDMEILTRSPGVLVAVSPNYRFRIQPPEPDDRVTFSADDEPDILELVGAYSLWQTAYAELQARGSATGRPDGTLASGRGRAESTGDLGLVNFGDAPLPVRVRVSIRGGEIRGSVDNDASEHASVSMWVNVIPRWGGGFDGPIDVYSNYEATRPPLEVGSAGPKSFDQFIVPFSRTITITVPPSVRVIEGRDETRIELEIFDVALWVGIEGTAGSVGSASAPLTFAPNPPPAKPGLPLEPPILPRCHLNAKLTRTICRFENAFLTAEKRYPARILPGKAFAVRWRVTAKRRLDGSIRIAEVLPQGFRALGQGSRLVFKGPFKPGERVAGRYRARASHEGRAVSTSRLRWPRGRGRGPGTRRLRTMLAVWDPRAGVRPPGEIPSGPPPASEAPDLVVSFLDEDTVTVANQGDAGAGPFVLAVTGATPNGTVPIGSFNLGGLAAGSSRSFPLVAPGATMITAVADSGNQVAEAEEQNNSRIFQPGPAPPAGPPDLVVSSLDKDNVTVTNVGESASEPSILTVIGLSPNGEFPIGTFNVGGLGAGGSKGFTFACPAGTTITATADSGNQVAEANEQNNTASFQVAAC